VEAKQMMLKGPDFSKDFYIFSLEWTPEELRWKINGVTVKKETQGIPDQPLYLIFNSGLQDQIDHTKLPGQMEIDWVVAYQAN
jgi:beta-glucanase (GH16 family)